MSAATKDRHAVGSFDWVTDQVYFYLQGGNQWPWVREVFPNSVIVAFDGDTRLFEYPWSIADGELALGEPSEVSVEYVTKRRAAINSPELTGPIVRKDAKRQVAYAAVLVPGEPDSDGEVLTAEKIESVAHGWLEDFRQLDADHSLKTIDAVPVESYIVPADITFGEYDLPAGTWVLATKVRDPEVWQRVEKGELTGYSIMGVAKADIAAAVEAFKSTGNAAFKRTLLADLGDDWVAPLVSIVDAPAVPKAKFFALKSETPPPTPETLFSKFKQWWLAESTSAAQGGESPQESEVEMTPEQITAAVVSAVKSELEPIVERLNALEKPAATETPETEPDTTTEDVAALKSEIEELKSQNAELTEFKADVEKRFAATPKSLTGQDGDDAPAATKSKPFAHRDGFGRRINA